MKGRTRLENWEEIKAEDGGRAMAQYSLFLIVRYPTSRLKFNGKNFMSDDLLVVLSTLKINPVLMV